MLVRLYEPEVSPLLSSEPGQVIESQRHKLDRITSVNAAVIEVIVALVLALSSHGPDQFDGWVIEIELKTNLGSLDANVVTLDLSDQLLERSDSESVTLLDVQVHVRGIQPSIQILLGDRTTVAGLQHQSITVGHDDGSLEGFKTNGDLDTMKLERHQRQSVTGGLSVRKWKRHPQSAIEE